MVARVTYYYEDRYVELDQSGWLAGAERVAARFQSRPTLTYEELKAAVADGLAAHAEPGQVHAALNALQRLGFVWRPPGQLPPVRYEPGIPSLMAHVLDHTAPARAAPRHGGDEGESHGAGRPSGQGQTDLKDWTARCQAIRR